MAVSASAASAVALMLVLARVPPSADLILPRRHFFRLFRAAIAAQQSAALSAALSWLALLLMLAAAAGLVWRVKASAGRLGLPRGAAIAAGLALLGAGARLALKLWLDMIQNVWSGAEGVGVGEAAGAFLAAFSAGLFVYCSGLALARGKALARLTGLCGALIFSTAGLYCWACARYDLRADSLSSAAGIAAEPSETRTAVLLTQAEGGRADYEVRTVALGSPGEADYSSVALERLRRYVSGPKTVLSLRAARHLYNGYTARMEPAALRSSLLLAHEKGDLLARLLLLDNLVHAPLNDGNDKFVEALADERAFRVGPRAALMLSAAFSHFGRAKAASYWNGRGARAGSLIAREYPSAPEAIVKGEIFGSVRGAGRVKVGVFEHEDDDAPYNLGPAQLVDAEWVNESGSFHFRGLGRGHYFLALALEPKGATFEKCYLGSGGRPPCISFIGGHLGDIHLSPSHPKAERRLELHLIAK